MKTIKIAAICALAALSMTAADQSLAEDMTKITVGVEGAFPPFNETRPDGTLAGLDLDVINEVCKRAKLDCDIVAQSWDSQIPSLVAGKFDVILTVGPNPERRKVIDFTNPYVVTPNTFLVAADGPYAELPHTDAHFSINNDDGKQVIEDLKAALDGAQLGGALSTSQLGFLEAHFADSNDIRSYKGSEQVVLDLEGGRLDAQFDNVVFARDRAEKSEGTLKVTGPLLVGGNMATDVCLGIRKDDTELRDRLNVALESMRTDGTLATLSEKWFRLDLSPQE